jgi:DNA-binding NtrC family response regulator
MTPLTILVVHPDPVRRTQLASALHAPEAAAVEADQAGAAVTLQGPSIDAVLLDLTLPGLDLELLRQAIGSPDGEPDSLEAAERRHLSLVLRHTGGNKRRAALILGISRSTLLNKVRKYRLEDC